jgi:hypothetical protein
VTPKIQAVSAVESPSPDATALSAASKRARKGAGSAESVDAADGAFFVCGVRVLMAAEKSAIFFSPVLTA